MISGTPTAPAGTFPFTVRVADTSGQQDTQALSLRVTPTTPPQITTTSLPNGTAGQPYSQRVQATGGIGTLAWSVSAGSLPAGLTLNPSGPLGGTISGTPLSGGSFNFTLRITDSSGQTDTQVLSISVTPLSITTTSLPSGSIGQAYSRPLQTIGGIAPLNWSIFAGTLPPGLNLDPTTGVISGTPIVPAGTSSFTVQVQDAGGQSDTQALSIVINLFNAPNITTATLEGGTVLQSYNQTLRANGGTGALTWTVSSGSLPAGLTLSRGWNYFGHSNQSRNLQFHRNGHRHIQSVGHAGSLDYRHRGTWKLRHRRSLMPRRARPTPIQPCKAREVSHP